MFYLKLLTFYRENEDAIRVRLYLELDFDFDVALDNLTYEFVY